MGKRVDLIGQTFGRLTVVEKHPELNKRGQVLWKCVCGCPDKTEVLKNTTDLNSGNTKSCGCLRKENTGAMFNKHGLSSTSEYKIWKEIRKRCYNRNFKQYHDYGGRGITVCDEWHKFEAFYRDMGPRPSPEHSIERRENDKGYSKNNCYWATRERQANNTRANVYYEIDGQKLTIAEMAKIFAFPYSTMRMRLLFMPVDAAVDPSVKFESCLFTLNDVTKTMKEWLEERGIKTSEFISRRSKGWEIAEALEPIHLREVEFEGQRNSLKFWCGLLGYDDPDEVYIRVLHGETLEEIVKKDAT